MPEPATIDYATLDYGQLDYSKLDQSKLDFSKMIPQDFQDKPWLKETKDLPSLLKRTDGLISELGKKPAGIPQENAKPEEWTAFNKAFGVPEKPEEYDIGTVPEGLTKNENFEKGMRSDMQKAGLNKRQAKMMAESYHKNLAAMAKEMGLAQEKNNTDFDKLATDTFGERKDKALATGKALLAKYTEGASPAVKEHIASMPNESLISMALVLDGIVKDYIKEDQLPGGKGGGAPTADEKRVEARKLMASEAFSNPNHPDHAATVEKVNSLYK
jgi:hypothetical protein